MLQQCLKRCPAEAVAVRYELLLHLAMALAPNESTTAAALYREALALPVDARVSLGARLNLAALLCREGQLEEAEAERELEKPAAPSESATQSASPRREPGVVAFRGDVVPLSPVK